MKLINGLAANPKGPGKNIDDIRHRSERVLRVAAASRQDLAGGVAKTQNGTSLHCLISAAHKMENHAQRTLLMIDLVDAFRRWDTAKDPAARVKLLDVFRTLQQRLDTLRRDTRVIADEMDELAYGPASQLI